jgi:hypothetical protein
MLSDDAKKTKTGDLGEKLVARFYRNQGHDVEESLNLFDFEKDMTIDGETCEVKTQMPWIKENAFSIREQQVKKCMNVDRLIFVETPSKFNDHRVHIYEFPKETRKYRTKITKDNRKMALFEKKNAVLLTTIEDDSIIEQFDRYNLSDWK